MIDLLRHGGLILAGFSLLALGSAGCTESTSPPGGVAATSRPGADPPAPPATGAAGSRATVPSRVPAGTPIGPANFVPGIDNPYLPLVPGTRFTYRGVIDGEPETVVVQVTRQTKLVYGVPAVVVRDTVTTAGELAEDTFDWFGQDRAGNVWYLGEAVKDFANGQVVGTAGSWQAGRAGAQARHPDAGPAQGGRRYQQEIAKGEAEDRARVVSVNERVTVPFGSFTGVVKIEETTPLEPNVLEYKYYARGVGLILAEEVRGEKGRSELVAVARP